MWPGRGEILGERSAYLIRKLGVSAVIDQSIDLLISNSPCITLSLDLRYRLIVTIVLICSSFGLSSMEANEGPSVTVLLLGDPGCGKTTFIS